MQSCIMQGPFMKTAPGDGQQSNEKREDEKDVDCLLIGGEEFDEQRKWIIFAARETK